MSANKKRAVVAFKDLAVNPRPYGYKKLKGRPGYRIRVGDYRIIYQVKDNVLTVYILIIGHRRDVYD
jgi:mRNA interferase RelE/StbE